MFSVWVGLRRGAAIMVISVSMVSLAVDCFILGNDGNRAGAVALGAYKFAISFQAYLIAFQETVEVNVQISQFRTLPLRVEIYDRFGAVGRAAVNRQWN